MRCREISAPPLEERASELTSYNGEGRETERKTSFHVLLPRLFKHSLHSITPSWIGRITISLNSKPTQGDLPLLRHGQTDPLVDPLPNRHVFSREALSHRCNFVKYLPMVQVPSSCWSLRHDAIRVGHCLWCGHCDVDDCASSSSYRRRRKRGRRRRSPGVEKDRRSDTLSGVFRLGTK